MRTPRPLLRLLWLAAWTVALALPVAADPGPMAVRSERGAELLEQGRGHMMAFRLDAADRSFEALAAAEPESAAAAFHLAKTAWWRALLNEDDARYATFFSRSDALLALLRQADTDPWHTHFRAETELHRAIAHARGSDYTKAALALRQAYNHFQRNTRSHPDFLESRWGMGLCYAAVGSVPRQYRWVLRLLGFRGTVPQGLQEIAVSVERSRFYREEAAAYYAVLDETMNEGEGGGGDRLRATYRRHPEALPIGFLYGFALLNERQPDEAERVLREVAAALARPTVHPIPYVDYYLADSLLRQDRFAEAAAVFERYLARYSGRALRAQAALRAGLARELAGDRPAALRHYHSIEVRRDYDGDASARQEADVRIARPLDARDRALLLGRTAFDGGRYREAVRRVQPVLTDPAAPAEARAEAAYRSGRAFHALEEWADAARHYQVAVSSPGDGALKWSPWSQFYLGEVHAAQGDREAARVAYQRALAYEPPFEYHKSLEQRARAALARL